MTDFKDCPACGGGSPERMDCVTCEGTGERTVSPENVLLALTAKDWADDQVSTLFEAWCRINGVHAAYGVERWECSGEEIRVIQDISCRGHYDTQDHFFPMSWLLAGPDEREKLITADLDERAKRDAAARVQADRNRIASLERELATLRARA